MACRLLDVQSSISLQACMPSFLDVTVGSDVRTHGQVSQSSCPKQKPQSWSFSFQSHLFGGERRLHHNITSQVSLLCLKCFLDGAASQSLIQNSQGSWQLEGWLAAATLGPFCWSRGSWALLLVAGAILMSSHRVLWAMYGRHSGQVV